MADKKISELDQTLNLSDQADFPLSQDNGGEHTTFRAKLTQIATKIAEAITFSNLKTGNKQLVSAVNQTISNLADDFNTTAGSTYAKDDCVLYNGVLYQCINNSGTTSGTFINADWTEIKAVDVGSGGGGGGGGAGGHTIVDDAGTSLTQRTNLQFKGAYSEDNSTDDTTEINVVREMTKAAFDQLTEAEKTGLINITDVTGGNDDRFQPVIYSTEEREIGVWTDGKPLYQKTVSLTNITIAVSGGYSYDISSWNVDTIVKNPEGFITLSNDTDLSTVPFGVLGNYATDITSTRSAVQFLRKGGDLTCNRVVFTLTYTKTTDTAGSGQWTPQGVPAVHYSEDEQVVGTWIDGSTIYKKTYTSSTYYYSAAVALLDLSSLAYDKIISLQVESELTIAGEGSMYFMPSSDNAYINTDKKVYARQSLASAQSGRTMQSYITIRYTKSST